MSNSLASSSREYLSDELPPIFSLREVRRFIKDCMLAIDIPLGYAEDLASCLSDADYRGHNCEGLNRLEIYVNEVLKGGCNKDAVPTILSESPVTAWVDGNNGLGVVTSKFCMELAIEKAKNAGIGWVVAKGSNNFGFSGYYSLKAAKEGLIGMCFTNTSPMVSPPRAKQRALGTNPISAVAPGLNEDNFFLDMSTAAVPVGKIEILSRLKESVPEHWADPETGALLPLGGVDPNSNFRGFGLGLLVEIFCGILSGSGHGPNIRKYGHSHEPSNLSHCFIVVNPNYFAPGFEERLSDLLNSMRTIEAVDPDDPVTVPGDYEREHMRMVDQQGGVSYVPHLIKSCLTLAEKLKVSPLTCLK